VSLERKALVVDDDAGIRLLVKRILSNQQFDVDVARDGAEALEKILANNYAVVMLDLMMPRVDGIAVVRHLAHHHPEKLSNIIVMTAFGASALREVCPPVGRFLEKPFEINHLVNEVTECYWMSSADY
jgi:DNA-binding response OmpR family regulator